MTKKKAADDNAQKRSHDPSSESPPAVDARSVFYAIRALFPLLRKHIGITSLTAAVGAVNSALESFGIGLAITVVFVALGGADRLDDEGVAGWFFTVIQRSLGEEYVNYGLVIAGLIIAIGIVSAGHGALFTYMDSRICHDLRVRMMGGLVRAEHLSPHAGGNANFMNTLQSELYEVSEKLNSISNILINVFALIVYFTVIAILSWPIALVLIGLAVFLFTILQFSSHFLRQYGTAMTQSHVDLARIALRAVMGIRSIKAFGAQKRIMKEFAEASEGAVRNEVMLAVADNLSEPVRRLGFLIALGLLLLISTSIGNSTALTLALVALLSRIVPYMQDTQSELAALIAAEAPIDLVRAAAGDEEAPPDPSYKVRRVSFDNSISFEGVGFRYPGAVDDVLRGVDFRIEKGRLTLIKGPSGSGKSTLILLLAGLTRPTVGRITIDEIDLADVDPEAWLAHIAFAGQSFPLLDDTVLENLRLGVPHLDEDEAWRLLEEVGAKPFVSIFPQGLNTVIGERGTQLSGGQVQRIGIARALARNPEILVLDEAANAVETSAEQRIYEVVRTARPELTLVVVTHRPNLVEHADMVVNVAQNRVVARATPRRAADGP